MLTLMKKNGYFFGLYLLALLPLMTLWSFTSSGELGFVKIMFQGQWLIIMVVGCVGVSEHNEVKNNGYIFLKTLPVSMREVVTAKFGVLLLAVLFLGTYNYMLLLLKSAPTHIYPLGRGLILMSISLALVLAAIMYLVIYRFGHSAFTKIAWIAVILVLFIPVALIEFVFPKVDLDVESIVETLISFPPMVWIALLGITLIIYWTLMQLAIRAKIAHTD